jgi:hypothetical protein
MYVEPWQVFLGGCVIGTLISLIVLTILIVNTIHKIGIKSIPFHTLEDQFDNEEDSNDTDLLVKLSFILLNRGCISDDDVDFMMDHITFEEWKKLVEAEIDEMEKNNDESD